MALKDLAADLESFKYGITSPDKIDGQIESGVDFFDNVEGGAKGFTPKAGDLESQYNSYQNANFGPVGGDVDYYANLNPITPFQSIFELGQDGFPVQPGEDNPLITLNIDNNVLNTVPQLPNAFGSDFMTTPLEGYVSRLPNDVFNDPPNISLYSQTFTIDTDTNLFSQQNNFLSPNVANAFGSDFMTTPISGRSGPKIEDKNTLTHFVDQIKLTGPVPENYQTEINVNPKLGNAAHNNSDSLSRLTNGSDNVAGVDIPFKLTPPHLNKFPTISSPNYNFISVLGGYNLLQTPEFDVDARRDKSRIVFGDKDLPTTALYYQPQFTAVELNDEQANFNNNAGIHNESNGASIHLVAGEDHRLALNGAHSTISITNELGRYSSLQYPYPTLNNGNPWGNGGNNDWGTDFQPLYPEAAPTNTKQRGTFDAYILGDNLSFANLSLDGDFFEETGESIHISNNNQISAGLRYGSMVEQAFERFDAGTSLTDVPTAPWSDTNPPFSQNFLNPLANHSSRFAILGDPSTVNSTHPVSLTWDLDTENNVGYDREGTLDGIASAWPDAVPTTDLNRIPQPQFGGETYLDGLTSFDGRVIITGETAKSTSSTLVINKNTYTAPGISGYNQTGYSETSVGENFTGYTFSTWKNTWKNSYKKDELGSFVSAENLILLTAGGEDNILEKRGGAVDFFNKRIFTIPDTYTISGDIQRYGKFDKEGVNEFMEVPAGLGQNNKMSTGTFRDVADPGKSNHPLVQREIGNNWGMDSFGDNPVSEAMSGMVRGAPGITGLIHRNITDKLRIFRWQFSTSDGLAFTLKQFGLQLLNPTIETKIWNPGSTLGLVGVGKLINAIIPGGPGNLNLNLKNLTLEGFKEYAKGVGGSVGSDLLLSLAFPIGHPERHLGGLRYEDVNPLRKLSEDTEPGESIHSIPLVGPTILDKINSKIDELGGGSTSPGSPGGVSRLQAIGLEFEVSVLGSKFNLRASDFQSSDALRMKLINPNKYLNPIPFSASPISIERGKPSFTGAKEAAIKDAQKIVDANRGHGITFSRGEKGAHKSNKEETDLLKRHSTLSYDKLKRGSNQYLSRERLGFTYVQTPAEIINIENGGSDIPQIEKTNREDGQKITAGMGHQGGITSLININVNDEGMAPKKDGKEYGFKSLIKGSTVEYNVDKVNILPYGAEVTQEGMKSSPGSTLVKDFIKFRFKDVVNNKYIIFRAILDGISDQVSPDFGGGERYVGRPDRLYIYQGTDRTVSFNFKVYPKTKQEFPILLEKLNYLVGLCYPSYTKNERMITPLMELTMGDMFNETPGLLNGLTLTVEDAGTWEIENGLQFPRYISAQCEFKHIGKHILASQGKHYDLPYIDDLSVKRNKGIGLNYQNTETGLPTRTGYQLLFETLGQKNQTDETVPDAV